MKALLRKLLKDTNLSYYRQLYKLKKNGKKDLETKKREIAERYEMLMGRQLDWENPKTYTEKLNYSKLLCANEEKTLLTDKILVRDWVVKKIGAEYLVPLLGVYDQYKDIDFSSLPDKFVLKCNHDSGSVTIVNEKAKMDHKLLKKRYNFWMKRNFADSQHEMHYSDIVPKIMVEKHMGTNINDYKFLCFDGEPMYCWVDSDRFVDHKRDIYDMEWKLQPFNQYHFDNADVPLEKPMQFEEMREIAKILSAGFDHVRVDLYVIDGKVYFGEMTFTSGSGFEKISPEEWDYKLGEMWKLEVKE